jgi:hypothetical protein
MIMPALDYDGLVPIAIAVLTLPDHLSVAIAVAMTGTNRHADTRRTNANPDFFRTRRHRNGNSNHRDGSYNKTLHHPSSS